MYLEVDLITSWEELCAPGDDGWDRGTDTYHLEGVKVIRRTEDHFYFVPDEEIKDGRVYVLIEDYSAGDTFGRTESKFRDVGVYPSWEAAEKASETMPKDTDYFGGHNQWIIRDAVIQPGH